MGHGADRTLMAGKLGIISVDVDGLDNAGEGHEQDTQQRQNCDRGVFARLVATCTQLESPVLIVILDIPRLGGTMHAPVVKL